MKRHLILFTSIVALAGASIATAALTAGSAIPAGNLVKNPGAESPVGSVNASDPPVFPAVWESEEGLTDPKGQPGRPVQSLRYGPHQFVLKPALSKAIGGGRSFFSGGYPGELSRASQMIDVSRAAAEIDAGGVKACLSAYLGGGLEGAAAQNPTARADLQFLGEDAAARGQFGIGPVTRGHRRGAATLLRRASERAVPAGTRMLKVSLTFTGFFASGAFADNVSVALTAKKGNCDPVLVVKCVRKALVATVNPSSVTATQRVRFAVKGAKGSKTAVDGRAPHSARFTMAGLTGRLAVSAAVCQEGGGTINLVKRSRRC
jgi:hypothetical protein